MVDINDSMLWAQDIRCYEKLMAMDDMKDSRLWAQGCGYDSTHGSLALKAYQQHLYLKYYY